MLSFDRYKPREVKSIEIHPEILEKVYCLYITMLLKCKVKSTKQPKKSNLLNGAIYEKFKVKNITAVTHNNSAGM